MDNIGLILLALVTLFAALYTHLRLPYHTAKRRNIWISRLLLLVLGVLFGWVTMSQYPVSGSTAMLVFLSAFGIVHVPAAFILFIKRLRGVEQ